MITARGPIQQYIENRFAAGLDCYERSLRRNGVYRTDRIIVDVGCGPGQWSFAASRIAPKADVLGFDPNVEEIEFANSYAAKHGFSKVRFEIQDYTMLLNEVAPLSVDVLLCNGVLMYLDRQRAFHIFSQLLRPGGRLLMFHNHRLGYYLKKTSLAIRDLAPKRIYGYGVKPLLLNLPRQWYGSGRGDAPLTLRRLKRLACRYGLDLWEVPTEPMLNYDTRFLGFPYIFSVAGIKR